MKNLVDGKGANKGLKLFEPKKKASSVTIAERKSGVQNHNHPIANNANKENEDHIQLNSKSTLFAKIMGCMHLHNVNEYVELQFVNDSIVTVHMEGTQIYGEVNCVLCAEDTKPKRVSYVCSKNSKYWVPSNFITHLKKVHNLSVSSVAPKPKQKKSSKHAVGTENSESLTIQTTITPDEIENAEVICMESSEVITNQNQGIVDWYNQISPQITTMSQLLK